MLITLFSIVLGAMRLVGYKHMFYQAVAHIWVTYLFMEWRWRKKDNYNIDLIPNTVLIARKIKKSSYQYLIINFIALVCIEVFKVSIDIIKGNFP